MLDITLSPGLAYFVEDTAYKEHVVKFANQEEVRPKLSLLIRAPP